VAGGALRLRAEEGRWRLGVTLTCGPQLAATVRKRKGGEGEGEDGPAAEGWNLGRWAGRAERGKRGEGWGFGIFFSLSSLQTFSNFKFKHLLTFQTLKLFKPYFPSFQIILKTFRTSHN
jgi:hypothetical protein